MFKKVKVYAMAAFLMVLSFMTMSCSKESMVEGSWQITSFVANGSSLNSMAGKIWTFSGGGSCNLAFADGAMTGQWKVNDDELIIYGTLSEYNVTYYQINSNLKIDKLKSESMTLSGTMYMNDGQNSGSIYLNVMFTKI